jgi:hypothetical protein
LAHANAAPACWPRDVGGTGSPIAVRTGIAGMAYAWHCPTERRIQMVAGPWSAFLPTWEAEARRLQASSEAEKRAAWARHVTRTAPLSAGVVALRDAAVADVRARYVR